MTSDPIDRLYDLAPAEFTAARNTLAAELRAGGDHDRAAEVKALRKPSRAAWAANRLIRAEPELIEALLGAGGELRQAHRQAASGHGATRLRDAAAAEREAVSRLVARLPEALGERPAAALSEAVRNSLHAAAGDDEARGLIASGRLTEELRPVGLGPVPGRQTGGSRPSAAAERERAAARDAAEREERIRSAKAAETALLREAEAAERSLERCEQRLARAREAAAASAERAGEARKRLQTARSDLRNAQRELRSLERR